MDETYRQGIESNTHTPSQVDYAISLDYVAVLSQGRSLARKFLYAMQDQILVRQNAYSRTMVTKILTDIGADMPLFAEERLIANPAMLLTKNQQFANQYKITKNPTAIIFDSNNNESGLIIENFSTTNLDEVLNQYLNKQHTSLPPYLVLHR